MSDRSLSLKPLWRAALAESGNGAPKAPGPFPVGVLEGEGIGPDVVGAALRVLDAVEKATPHRSEVVSAHDHGVDRVRGYETPLSPALMGFCEGLFQRGGALLAGPGGGRFVYDLRQALDLFCKLVPVRPFAELKMAGRLRHEHLESVDLVIVRENVSGLYFGTTVESRDASSGRRVDYTFSYSEREICQIIQVAAAIAATRTGRLTVVTKEGGLPGVSDLWRACALDVARSTGVEMDIIHIDYAAYLLVQHAQDLDVVVTSNMFGDVLSDVSALLLGSRGMSYSANFASSGAAVYQTNHGAAHDLVGRDQANPLGQILSLAMMLCESFGRPEAACLVESAVGEVLGSGWRTLDIAEDGCRAIGTKEMAERVADAVIQLSSSSSPR